MVAIKLTAFSGEQPRIIPRLMAETAAQSAINTRLDDGALTPMRRAAHIATAVSPASQSIYLHQGEWLEWPGHVNAVQGPVAGDRLYYTGDGVPKMLVDEDVYPLAVPRPSGALTATLDGSGSGDITTRLYVYTVVTEMGEESEPSPVSNEVAWQPGHDVVLSGFATPPSGRAIDRQRIYRSQGGQAGNWFYFIHERVASNANYTDTVAPDAFQEPLPSASWNAPPDGLSGLTALPNGMMAAFVGQQLYFCEPWRPHAWPEKYVLTTDWPIVGLGAIGTSIFVLTTGQPYVVAGTAPETMQMSKLEFSLPCINARGIVDMGYAIAYPSHEGLVVIRADGSFSLATAHIFDRDAWLALSPQTMVAGQIAGRYVAFYDADAAYGQLLAGALLIDLATPGFLIRTDATATATFFDVQSGALYFLHPPSGSIRRLDAPYAARRLQYWKSKQFVLPKPHNFGAIQIDVDSGGSPQEQADLDAEILAAMAANAAMIAAGTLNAAFDTHMIDGMVLDGDLLEPMPTPGQHLLVSVYADGTIIASKSIPGRPLRLPAGFLARTWEIDVFGDIQVQQIVMATTIDELKELV